MNSELGSILRELGGDSPMAVIIRRSKEEDENIFTYFTTRLVKYNQINHNKICISDDNCDLVMNAIQKKAEETFNNKNEDSLILIAECDSQPVGYALGRIYNEDETADNGTGRMGLLDEIFIEDSARGLGIGNKLIDETIKWMKEKGINRVKLHAYSWNTKAKKHYERKGFKEYAVSYEMFL